MVIRHTNRRTSKPVVSTPGDWRGEVVTASSVNLLAGTWLIASPFIAGYTVADAQWNPIVAGSVVFVLALVRVAAPEERSLWLSVVNTAVGAWLVVSAYWLATSGAATANAWIVGLLVFVLAISSAITSTESRRVTPM